MGRRSRKRMPDGTPVREPAQPPGRPSRVDRFIAQGDERPKAPWHPFPLVEIAVLVGIVLIVLGLINAEDSDGRMMLVFGLVLASLGGLDTALREHFAGFKSHSLLLAGLPAVLVAAGLYFLGPPWPLVVAAAVLTFGAAFWAMRAAFRRRAGVAFKA